MSGKFRDFLMKMKPEAISFGYFWTIRSFSNFFPKLSKHVDL